MYNLSRLESPQRFRLIRPGGATRAARTPDIDLAVVALDFVLGHPGKVVPTHSGDRFRVPKVQGTAEAACGGLKSTLLGESQARQRWLELESSITRPSKSLSSRACRQQFRLSTICSASSEGYPWVSDSLAGCPFIRGVVRCSVARDAPA